MFQIDRLVVARSGITVYGRYVQALRELYGRYRGIRGCLFQLEELSIRMKKLKSRVAALRTSPNCNEGGVPLLEADLELRRLRVEEVEEGARLKGLCYEFSRYFVNADALKDHLGPMSSETVEQHEKELMLAQVRVSMAKDCLQGRILQPETWQLVCALETMDRQLVLSWLGEGNPKLYRERTVDYFLSQDEPFPAIEPSADQVGLLGKKIVGLIRKNPELNYGAPTNRSDGIPEAAHDSLRSHLLQNNPC